MDEIAGAPDIYTESFSITMTPTGPIIAWMLPFPTTEPGARVDGLPQRIVGRTRMSPALAASLIEVMTKLLAQAAAVNAPVRDGGAKN